MEAEGESLEILWNLVGGKGFEIGDGDVVLLYLMARDLHLVVEREAVAESMTAHKAASSRSLSSIWE